MSAQFDLAESAFADGLSQNVLAYFTFVWCQLHISSVLVGLDADLIRVADSLVDFLGRALG